MKRQWAGPRNTDQPKQQSLRTCGFLSPDLKHQNDRPQASLNLETTTHYLSPEAFAFVFIGEKTYTTAKNSFLEYENPKV
jgi:hypothetical protein